MTDAAPGAVLHVSAAALRDMQDAAPFESGLLPLDATATIVVEGSAASDDSLRAVLRRAVGDVDLTRDASGNIVVPAADMLSGAPSMAALRQIYARLRRPDGCPWDREQTELLTVPHIVEEATELREALEAEDWAHAAEELGDVLGNVIMIAQIASEQGRFTFEDVLSAISTKLVRRHPHVFGDQTANSPDEVLAIWNQVKELERAAKSDAASDNEYDNENGEATSS